MTCAFDGAGQLTLKLGRNIRDTTGQNLTLLVEIPLEKLRILIVDVSRLGEL